MVKLGQYLLKTPCILPITILCALSVFIFLPGLFLASIIIVLFTLERGYRVGGKLLLGVLIPFIALMLWQKTSILLILFFMGRYVLIWFIAGLYARYLSWRLVLETLTVMSISVIIFIHFALPDIMVYWNKVINYQISIYSSLSSNPLVISHMKQQMLSYANMASGIAAVFVSIDCCIHILLAKFWQKRIHFQASPHSQSNNHLLRMGSVFTILLMILTLAKLFDVPLALDCWPVILFPFVVCGLFILHQLSVQYRFLKWVMILVYLGLALGYSEVFCLLAVIASVDSLNLQKYYPLIRSFRRL